MRKKIYSAFVLLALLVAGMPAWQAAAAEHSGNQPAAPGAALLEAPCTIDLAQNTASHCSGVVTFVVGPSGGKTVMRLNLSCKAAHFDVYYSGTPSGWTVNIGDSITNDGWGGDTGTQSNDAELQVVNQGFSVYASDYGSNRLLLDIPTFAAPGQLVSFTVGDNSVAYSSSYGSNGSLTSPYLYALAGQADPAPGGVNYDIYAAFNRVIANASRSGTGVTQVIVHLYNAPCV